MRKFVSLSAVAILLAALTTSVHADAADGVCDILKDKKYTKSLYGLCVAYWSGDADKSKILTKYNDRKQLGDPEYLPGTEPPVDDPDSFGDICPCFDPEAIAEITFTAIPDACGTIEFTGTDLSHDFAIFDLGDMQIIAGTPLAFPEFSFPTACRVVAPGVDVSFETTAEEDADCRAVVKGLSDLFSSAGIDCGWTD